MKVLFDVNHPAQVHLFRNAIDALQAEGHETLVTSRDKEMTLELLDAYDVDHRPLTAAADGLLSLVAEWTVREVKMARVARKFDPDVVVSRLNPAAVHASRVVGCRNLVIKDCVLPEPMRTLIHRSTLRFVDDVCTPPGFDLEVPDEKHHDLGLQELAYLHPNRFEPSADVLRTHGISPKDTFFVVRFSAWDAYHDVGKKGLSPEAKRELLSFLADRGEVYVTSEAELPDEFANYRLTLPPEHVHHLLYYADCFVGDSETMSTEAALLGTPTIRIHPFVGEYDLYNFDRLEESGLLFSFTDETTAIEKAKAIARDGVDASRWARRRDELLEDEQDVTAAMLELVRGEAPEPETPAPTRTIA